MAPLTQRTRQATNPSAGVLTEGVAYRRKRGGHSTPGFSSNVGSPVRRIDRDGEEPESQSQRVQLACAH
jgi:hypothetical protein